MSYEIHLHKNTVQRTPLLLKQSFSFSFFFVALLSPSLLFLEASNIEKKDLFIEKYIKKDSSSFKQGKKTYGDSYRNKLSKDVNLSQVVKQDINNTSYDVNLSSAINNQEAIKNANVVNKKVRSSEFASKVKDYEDYILQDKELGLKDKMGNYSKLVGENKHNPNLSYKNKYLAHDERLIIAISSSIPIDTLKNFFDSLTEVYSDVSFVLNGFIGNDPKYIMPTIEYTKKLLEKRNTNTKHSEDDRYLFRVDINPKIFNKYSLERVPAVIFVKNYNSYSETQGNKESFEENGLEQEL